MLFSHFINQVTLFWRDKRISDVVRERAFDPSFGSIAVVRRAGLELRDRQRLLALPRKHGLLAPTEAGKIQSTARPLAVRDRA